MNQNKTIILSGKISGLPFEQVLAMFNHAEQVCKSCGYTDIFNPPKHIDQTLPYEKQMQICFNEIEKRDELYQLNNWMDSPGGRDECVKAIKEKKLITNENKMIHDFKNNSSTDFSMDHKTEQK